VLGAIAEVVLHVLVEVLSACLPGPAKLERPWLWLLAWLALVVALVIAVAHHGRAA